MPEKRALYNLLLRAHENYVREEARLSSHRLQKAAVLLGVIGFGLGYGIFNIGNLWSGFVSPATMCLKDPVSQTVMPIAAVLLVIFLICFVAAFLVLLRSSLSVRAWSLVPNATRDDIRSHEATVTEEDYLKSFHEYLAQAHDAAKDNGEKLNRDGTWLEVSTWLVFAGTIALGVFAAGLVFLNLLGC